MAQYIYQDSSDATIYTTAATYLLPKGTYTSLYNLFYLVVGSSGNLITVKGDFTAYNEAGVVDGIREQSTSQFSTIKVAASGSITATGSGIITSGWGTDVINNGYIEGAYGVSLMDNDQSLINNGVIKGTSGLGITASGSRLDLTNTGKILGEVNLNGDFATVVNTGLIKGGSVGIDASMMNFTLFNSGTIKGDVGVQNYAMAVYIENDGKIIGTATDPALQLFSGILNNTGLIYSSFGPTAVVFEDIASVTNSGEIEGGILLGYGDDYFENEGRGKVLGVVQGEAGDDTLIGGKKDDHLHGGADLDLLNGRNGNDTLTGGSEADVFVFRGKRPGVDMITDFEDMVDAIDLSAYGDVAAIEAGLNGAMKQKGDNVIIDLDKLVGKEGKIKLLFTDINDISIDDFVFPIT